MRAIHWFRHDLRLRDNAALTAAAEQSDELVPVFILDDSLLHGGRSGEPRTRFLLDSVARLAGALEARGSRLVLRRGEPGAELEKLLHETHAEILSFGRAYAPAALRRDARVRAAAARAGARVIECKDHVVFESREVLSTQDRPFAVYTPYRRAWERAYEQDPQTPLRAPKLPPAPAGIVSVALPEAGPAHEGAAEIPTAGEAAAERRLARFLDGRVGDYERLRDVPAEDATSRLSAHLRFGTISARTCIHAAREVAAVDRAAAAGARKWIDELVWREFYWAILTEHPRVTRESYRREFDCVRWNDDPEGFAAWCEGRTGYPIVDAGMRQLARTGWMHNRVRMIVASFLTKDLLIDWRRGEEHFYRLLVDGDPASNNGGWQWAASTGTDAQPYFRIFNPVSQGERFDPGGRYVRRFAPELAGVPDRFVHRPWEAASPPADYPAPIVSHAERRILALQRYEAARSQGAAS
jgi:deoxyribodipyrimidine photo-lyase